MSDAVRVPPGGRLDDADFSGARLHGPNFEGTRITDGWFRNAEIEGAIEGLRVNGVDVAPLVDAALDERFPERVMLRAASPSGLADAWEMLSRLWDTTVARARGLPAQRLTEQVDGDYSFIETLRHLIFATDAWLVRMVHGAPRPYHPWGLVGPFFADPARLGLDAAASPGLDEVLAVRAERMGAVRATIAGVTTVELERSCVAPDDDGHPIGTATVLKCLHVILAEEWEHNQYAIRDLGVLERT